MLHDGCKQILLFWSKLMYISRVKEKPKPFKESFIKIKLLWKIVRISLVFSQIGISIHPYRQ